MVNGPLKELPNLINFLMPQPALPLPRPVRIANKKFRFFKEYKDKTYLFLIILYHFLSIIRTRKHN